MGQWGWWGHRTKSDQTEQKIWGKTSDVESSFPGGCMTSILHHLTFGQKLFLFIFMFIKKNNDIGASPVFTRNKQ